MSPKKILMLAMSMGYGGAETHILELALKLKSDGYTVAVASSGGIYDNVLTSACLEHINIQLTSKNPFVISAARAKLSKLIKEFSPDIVHAHARIPAFVAKPVCRRFKIPLVTTAHGIYKMNMALNMLTSWGDFTVSVSDDITEHLVRDYNIPRGFMLQTVNGINTEKFSPSEAKNPKLRAKLGIGSDEFVILTVSRLDEHSSLSATVLCDIAPELYKKYPNSRIVIVGDGTKYNEIHDAAKSACGKTAEKYVICTGGSTEVSQFCQMADISIGISRSALEAAACGIPTVLCGDMGYIGRLSVEHMSDAVATNFTCRGFGFPANLREVVLADIEFILKPENIAIVGYDAKLALSLVRKNYSVGRMAADTVAAYTAALDVYRPHDIVLSGYYGFGNTGDDAILLTAIDNINRECPGIKMLVLAKKPKLLQNRLSEYFHNTAALYRFNYFKVKQALIKSKALVFGGGTLIQDSTSTKSLIYYLYLLSYAQKNGVATMLYANGIGPLKEKNIERAGKVISALDFITLRDSDSLKYIPEQKKPMVKVTADEVVTITPETVFYPKNHTKPPIDGEYICVCVRRWKFAGQRFYSEFAEAINSLIRKRNLKVIFVPMQSDIDLVICNNISEVVPRSSVFDSRGDISAVLDLVRHSRAVISMRLHLLIFAATAGIPMIGISYDPKVASFLSTLTNEGAKSIEIKDFSKEILEVAYSALESDYDSIKTNIAAGAAVACKSARSNAVLFAQAYRSLKNHAADKPEN